MESVSDFHTHISKFEGLEIGFENTKYHADLHHPIPPHHQASTSRCSTGTQSCHCSFLEAYIYPHPHTPNTSQSIQSTKLSEKGFGGNFMWLSCGLRSQNEARDKAWEEVPLRRHFLVLVYQIRTTSSKGDGGHKHQAHP
jgi:hypothetical protein